MIKIDDNQTDEVNLVMKTYDFKLIPLKDTLLNRIRTNRKAQSKFLRTDPRFKERRDMLRAGYRVLDISWTQVTEINLHPTFGQGLNLDGV